MTTFHENSTLKSSTDIFDYVPDRINMLFPTTAEPKWSIGDLVDDVVTTKPYKKDVVTKHNICIVLSCKFSLGNCNMKYANVGHAYFIYELYSIKEQKTIVMSQQFLICDPAKVENR